MLREDLVSVLKYLHQKGINIHLPVSQIGLDDEVAEAIEKYFNTVCFSTDGLGSDDQVLCFV